MHTIEAQGLGSSKTKTYFLREFDSIDDMLQYVKTAPNPKGINSKPHDYGFFDADSFDEAWDRAYNGWDTIRNKVDQTLEPLREQLRDLIDPVNTRVHDIIGYEPDIDRFVAGELECMYDDMMIEAPHAGRVFTVLLDNSLSCAANKDSVIRTGAVVIALIEAFQMFGFELEIYVETTVSHWGYYDEYGPAPSSDYLSYVCRVAKAGERPDINAIMFPLANPDWCRRFLFGMMEAETPDVRRTFGAYPDGSGYGCHGNGAHHGERVGASIELSLQRPDYRMSTDSVGWIIDQLKAQGVVADVD
jgi:hypothetical protein